MPATPLGRALTLLARSVLPMCSSEASVHSPSGQSCAAPSLQSAVLRGARAGVHINGYVETPDGLELWVARRSRTKATWPGKLDHIVAGGQPAKMTCAANVIKARL